MVIGVTAFATATSYMTNLVHNYDAENVRLNEKLLTLNKIKNDYELPLNLYENVKKSLKSQYKNDVNDLLQFCEELPQDLRVEVSLFIFEKTFKQIQFFKNRNISFIAWICPLLRPLVKLKEQYIYFEDDDVSCIYFFKNGKAGYVLPRHRNLMYIEINRGHQFGISCIVGSFSENNDFDLDNWISHRDKLKRQFTT